MPILIRASVMLILTCVLSACQTGGPSGSGQQRLHPLQDLIRPPASTPLQDGVAAVILLDTSGSMRDRLTDADGQSKPKLGIAQRALMDLVRQFDEFGRKNPDRKLLVGIYEFSSRDDEPVCREVLGLAPPNLAEAEQALQKMTALGGTPIGDAMIVAKHRLDAAGLTRRHILVITDGENNRGYAPEDVADAISRLPEDNRASIYFIAFDTQAEHFKAVRDAGGLVLAAANERDLRQTLDFVLTGKILVEEPVTPAGR